MPAIPFINRLDADDAYRLVVSAPGKWQAFGAETPDLLARGIAEISAEAMHPSASIPSIWAHAWFFYRAWDDSQHPSHAYAVELWRRFVCLVALRATLPESRRVTLSHVGLAPTRTRGSERVPDPSAPQVRQVADFGAAAALQFPHSIFATDPREEVQLYAVHLAGQAIGLLVPGMMCLPGRALLDRDECPSALAELFDIEDRRVAGDAHSWFYEDFLTQHYRRQLAGFLAVAAAKAGSFRPAHPKLQAALLAFSVDLNAAGALDGAPPAWQDGKLPAPPPWREQESRQAPRTAVAEPIALFGLSLAGGDQVRTATLLVDRGVASLGLAFVPISATDKSSLYLQLDIGNGELVREFVQPPAGITRQARLSRFRATSMSEPKPRAVRVVLLTEEDVFETHLIRLPNQRTANASPGLLGREYLLPATPLALALLGPQQLLSSLSIEPSDDPAAGEEWLTVNFLLTLEDRDPHTGMSTIVRMSRTYRRNDGTLVEASPADALTLWPDFIMEDGAGARMPTLAYQARGSDFPGLRAEDLLARDDLIERLRTTMSRPLGPAWPLTLHAGGDQPGKPQPIVEPGRDRHDLLHTRSCAEAVQFVSGQSTARGLLLRHTHAWRTSEDKSQTGVVSIDFGTSSTTVAFQVGEQEPTTSLYPHVWSPFWSNVEQDASEYLNPARFFLPPVETLPTPFPSVLQIRVNPKDTDDTPLMRARIPFPDKNDREQLTKMIRKPPPSTRMEFKLKWAEEEERGILVQQLLYSIMLLAFAHARSLQVERENLEWRLTIPKVMSADRQKRYRKDAENALIALHGRQNADLTKLRFFWESAAVHAFVRSRSLSLQKPLMATVDIGGQTTDICISSGGRILADGSADFAGRVMLVDFWADCWTQFEGLVKEVTEAARAGQVSASPALAGGRAAPDVTATDPSQGEEEVLRKRVALVELQLGMPDFDLVNFIKTPARMEKNALLQATALRIRFSYLALLYFLIHHGLKPAVLGSDLPDEARSLLANSPGLGVFLGGRGSKLFRLFCWDARLDAPMFQDVIERWLGSIGWKNASYAAVLADRNAKQEVALGCLALEAVEALTAHQETGFAAPRSMRSPLAQVEPVILSAAEARPTPFGNSQAGRTGSLWDGPGTFEGFCTEVGDILGDGASDVLTRKHIQAAQQAAGNKMPQPKVEVGFRGFETLGGGAPEQCPRRRFVLTLNAFLALWDKPGKAA